MAHLHATSAPVLRGPQHSLDLRGPPAGGRCRRLRSPPSRRRPGRGAQRHRLLPGCPGRCSRCWWACRPCAPPPACPSTPARGAARRRSSATPTSPSPTAVYGDLATSPLQTAGQLLDANGDSPVSAAAEVISSTLSETLLGTLGLFSVSCPGMQSTQSINQENHRERTGLPEGGPWQETAGRGAWEEKAAAQPAGGAAEGGGEQPPGIRSTCWSTARRWERRRSRGGRGGPGRQGSQQQQGQGQGLGQQTPAAASAAGDAGGRRRRWRRWSMTLTGREPLTCAVLLCGVYMLSYSLIKNQGSQMQSRQVVAPGSVVNSLEAASAGGGRGADWAWGPGQAKASEDRAHYYILSRCRAGGGH